MAEIDQPDLTTLTVQLLSAYVSNNSVPSTELAGLIETTRAALAGKSEPETPAPPEFEPAVTVRKSTASRNHILSMIDGKAYKSLKRHLSSHGLTPAEYRKRYNLADDYPMVAPGYSEQRREVAKRLGLGRKPKVAVPAPEPIAAEKAGSAAGIEAPKARGRTSRGGASAPSAKAAKAPRANKGNATKVAKKPAGRKAGAEAPPSQASQPTE